jgi:hypothetical protein
MARVRLFTLLSILLSSLGCDEPEVNAAPREVDDSPVRMEAAAPGAAPEITRNTIIDGALEAGDLQLADESLGDDYAIMLGESEPVTVVTRGGDAADGAGTLDVMTVLLFNDREVANDDDSAQRGAAMNSRIVYSPPVSGLYVIRVTSSGGGQKLGAYELQTYPRGALRQL